jgi:hypothetical protein
MKVRSGSVYRESCDWFGFSRSERSSNSNHTPGCTSFGRRARPGERIRLCFARRRVLSRTTRLQQPLLDGLAAVIEPVRLSFLWRPRLKDAADEMVLETAVNGTADRLVTFNLKHLGQAALEFGIRAVKPGEAWREVTEKQNEKK